MFRDDESPLILGVDYYPEQWPQNLLEEDLNRIAATGANSIRIGEFAWHLMEPQEGQFSFDYFDHVIEKATKKGLKIIFGTPTATFPAWLAKKDSSIFSRDNVGNIRGFGGRRQYCFNSEVYRYYAQRITEKVVVHYAKHPGVIAWQVDNELGHEGSDTCWCPSCGKAWHRWLEEKYRSIEGLNQAWGTIFWSQTYNEFGEIPMPLPTITSHNPGLLLDWARFRSDSLVGFAKEMIQIIKKNRSSAQLITHNYCGGGFNKNFRLKDLADLLDVVAYDNYPVWGGLETPITPAHIALGLDTMRGLKRQNFWVMEQLMGAQGHTLIGYLPRPNQGKLWSFQAMARGSKALMYFRWRGMTQGAEQFCLGLVDAHNNTGRKVREAAEFFSQTKSWSTLYKCNISASVAVLYDYDNMSAWKAQPQSSGFDYTQEVLRSYEPFYKRNLMIDVCDIEVDWSCYRILVLPVQQMIEKDLANRLEQWVIQGGILLFTFRTGIKDKNNALHFGMPGPGYAQTLVGGFVEEAESLGCENQVVVKGVNKFENQSGTFTVWRDLMVAQNAEILFKYADAPYQQYGAVLKNALGKGWVYTVGGGADTKMMQSIAEEILKYSEIDGLKTPDGVETVGREDLKGHRYRLWCNHTHQVQQIGDTVLEPYGFAINFE